jgi:exonuclease III
MILWGEARRAVIGYTTISEWIMAIRLFAKPKNLTLLQVYAPTATKKNEKAVDDFYEEMQSAMDVIKKEDICIVMGDLNSKVGGEDKQCGIGMHGLGMRNESGDKLA